MASSQERYGELRKLLRKEQFEKALAVCAELRAADADDADARKSEVVCLLQLGRDADALAACGGPDGAANVWDVSGAAAAAAAAGGTEGDDVAMSADD